ncbi:MAG: AAA domain-containing protein [Balneolales bacterium]
MLIRTLIEKAISAVDSEIEAVLEKPSRDVLWSGTKESEPVNGHFYRFETTNPSLRFAEKFKATIGDKTYEVTASSFPERSVVLKFPKNEGKTIHEVTLEWESDFILKRIKDHLFSIRDDENTEKFNQIEKLFYPGESVINKNGAKIKDDGDRNPTQVSGIEMAMREPVSFIWGPPGTGKTSTLGYIIANYLLQGKRVLFASNTNRAVDVGMISTIQALTLLGETTRRADITRYGEAALDQKGLEDILFDKQLEQITKVQKELNVRKYQVLEEFRSLIDKYQEYEFEKKKIPAELSLKLQMATNKIEEMGGVEVLEDNLKDQESNYDQIAYKTLKSKKLVGTTLARVCTSDILFSQQFDAVVVDEASMANLPYLMVLASKAKSNIVMVGDPMQLPPIALSRNKEDREFLEQDIFAFASKAKTTADLFMWHDANPNHTGFFDTQYRLNSDLADVISRVFYEGRLKTDISKQKPKKRRKKSMHVINSAPRNPFITQKSGNSGFQPKNEVHEQLVMEMVQGLVYRKNLPMREIGIIVPFRSTAWDLRKLLSNAGFNEVEVGTIHTFQGREKLAIIFDTVMSGEIQNSQTRHYSVRPFDETKNGLSVPRLLNVAFSRSKENLYVVCDMKHIRKVYGNKFLGKLLIEMKK